MLRQVANFACVFSVTSKMPHCWKCHEAAHREDRTCRGGGLLIYINSNLAHERMDALEIFWDESIWIKIKQNSQFYLFGIFYSPSYKSFFERLNQKLVIVFKLDITKNVVIMGDLNEDMLNPNNHNLKNVLLMNSLNNIITKPTEDEHFLILYLLILIKLF